MDTKPINTDKNKTNNKTEIKEPEYDIAHMVSANEWTGMLHMPQDEENYESYMSLLDMPPLHEEAND